MKKLSSTLLDYADIIYDKPFDEAIKNKLEMVQYCAAVVNNRVFKACVRYFLSFFFSPNDSPSKNVKIFLSSFPHFPDTKGQMEVE